MTKNNGAKRTSAPSLRAGRDELARHLVETRAMGSDWAPTFGAVDRASFLPPVMWPAGPSEGPVRVDGYSDRPRWQRYADADVPIVTQWDDGGSEPAAVATSSAPAPSTVMSMLRDLDVQPGMRVLEIGTGVGWTAALLAHRLGSDHVVTMEVDKRLARIARRRLSDAGVEPIVLEHDGLDGDPAGAPYDRLIATCGLREIPLAWFKQVRPGGIILAPWGTAYGARDALAKLIVDDDGTSASGEFLRCVDSVEAQTARGQRDVPIRHADYVPDPCPATVRRSRTHLGPEELTGRGPDDAHAFVLGLMVPQATHTVHRPDGRVVARFYSLNDDSWATVSWDPGGGPGRVCEHGARELWTEVESALHWWNAERRPHVDCLGLTVYADGEHRTWLDRPDHALPLMG